METPLAMKIEEAAAMLAVSRRTIYRLAKTGKIRIVRITTDSPRVLRSDIDAFLSTCEIVGIEKVDVEDVGVIAIGN